MKTVVKTILGTAAFSFFLVSASFAQDASDAVQDVQDETSELYEQTKDAAQEAGEMMDEAKAQIASEELPYEVSSAIDDSEYAEWNIAEAYELEKEEEGKQYEVLFQNPEGEIKSETFTEKGEMVAK